jgi:hypothetical protein
MSQDNIIHPNWFLDTGAQGIFKDNLSSYAGKKIDFLQIGAFTGDASLWLLENVLTHPESTLTDVDIWTGDPGIGEFDWGTAYVEYKQKLTEYSDKLFPNQMKSDYFFKQNTKKYDMIYIDGNHIARAVLRDAINSFDCLKDGGLLIFDDYVLSYHEHPAILCSKPAIDAFIDIHWFEVEKVYEGTQMWLKKKISNTIKNHPVLGWISA